MTGTTGRFNLTLGDALTDHDKAVIDAVLAAFETHQHKGGDRLPDPTGPLAGVLATTGGALAAGTSFFYRVSYLDRFGLETAASAEVIFTTPGGLVAPDAPALAVVAGGNLAMGTTYYALSAVDAAGNETVLSDPRLIAITDKNTVNLTPPPFADVSIVKYNVWRQGARSTGFTKIGSITDTSIDFVDSGGVPDDPCACDPTNLPPVQNRTNATSKVTFTVPDPALLLTDVLAWRIYRATSSGAYGRSSLLQEITTTVNSDGTGGLVTTFVDDGTFPLMVGSPLDRSETLTPTVLIKGGGGGSYVENPILTDNSGQNVYRVDVENGVLITYASFERTRFGAGTYYPIGGGPCFAMPGAVLRLTVDSQGVLVLDTAVVDQARDKVYEYGFGPRIVAPQGLKYDLTIDAGGALVLTDAA